MTAVLGRQIGLGGRGMNWCIGGAVRAGTQWQRIAISGQFCRGILTQSHAVGPTDPPLLLQTIPQHFATIVSSHGDRAAIISRAQNTTLSYRELDQRSNVLAQGLRERGVRKGDRVAVSLGNNWEFAVVTYALFKLGAVLVPLNPAFNSTQIISALAHLDATQLIIGAETNLPFKPPRENVSLLRDIVPDLEAKKLESAKVPSLKDIILVDNSSSRIETSSFTATTPFSSLLNDSMSLSEKEVVPDSPLNREDIINIQFTSGTTSSPKAACLTHTGILNNGYFIGLRMGLTPTDIVCCPPPLFHCFGCILGYMATATHGSAILFPSEAFNPRDTLLSIQEYGATALYGVATMFVAELELLANKSVEYKGFEHLRTGIAAGSSVPSHLMQKLHNTLNLTGLTICYGMTETSPVSCMTTPDDPLQKRLDSVGRLLPHVEAKVVDVHDRSKILPIGERGELVVSGYNVMKGYWGDQARTEEVRVIETIHPEQDEHAVEIEHQGKKEKVWMHTGDEAEMDEDGYVKITGRIKDLIIRGGENIHPLEVENVLFMMDEVSEASVVGLPDERYGECVAAFIVPHKGVRVGVDDAGAGNEFVDAHGTEKEDRKMEDLAELGRAEGGEVRRISKEKARTWVRERLSHHLVPKYVFWVTEYPKTASGKIQKFKLREMGIKMLESRN